MLNVSQEGEIVALAPNVEFHGDDAVKSVAIKIIFKNVAIEIVEEGLVGQMSLFYAKDGLLKLADLEPDFKVSRTVENIELKAGGATLSGMRVRKSSLKLLDKRLVDVTLTVQGQLVDGLDKLHNILRRRAHIEVIEHEPLAERQAA